jgi:hypothetical protein
VNPDALTERRRLDQLPPERQRVLLALVAAALDRRALTVEDCRLLAGLLAVGDGQALVTLNGGHVRKVQRVERAEDAPPPPVAQNAPA